MNSISSHRKIEAQLIVDHPKLLSKDLEEILQMSKDVGWSVGEHYKPSKSAEQQRYMFSRWAILETGDSLDFLTETLEKIVLRLRVIESRFCLLPKNTRVSLTIFANDTNTVIGFGIDPSTIKLLSKINADFEVSLVVQI
jgi:hypothetical protein